MIRRKLTRIRLPNDNKIILAGSGTAVLTVVYVASSRVKELRAESPVIVTLEIPLAKFTCRNSLGGLPEETKLAVNADGADATWVLAASKARMVKASAYVK